MLKKLFLLICIGLSFACARSANQVAQTVNSSGIQTQSNALLWQQHGGTETATNVVSNQLPSRGSISAGDTQNGFQIYTAPLVFSDSNATQHVYALWAQTGNLKLAKYTLSNGNFTRDSTFDSAGTLPYVSGDEFSSHQIAIHQTDTGLTLFIAHKDGIDKLDAYTGRKLTTYTSNSPVYRLTVSSNILYAQSATQMLTFDIDLNQMASFTVDTYHPTNQLPLIVSGDALFFEHDNKVYKTPIASFSDKIEDTQNLNHDYTQTMYQANNRGSGDTEDYEINSSARNDRTVTAMSAIQFNEQHSVVYAIVRHFPFQKNMSNGLVNTANDTAFFIYGQSPSDTFDFNRDYFISKLGSYSNYCMQFRNINNRNKYQETFDRGQNSSGDTLSYTNNNLKTNAPNYISACAFGAGDSEHTPLAVHSNDLYLPGVYWNRYTCQNSSGECKAKTSSTNYLAGIQRLPKGAYPVHAFTPDSHTIKSNNNQKHTYYNSVTTDEQKIDFFYTNRFVIHDSSQNITFTVANISDYFFSEDKDRSNGSFANHLLNNTWADGIEVDGNWLDPNTIPYTEILPNDPNQLTAFNSKVIVGNTTVSNSFPFSNTSMTINAVSVGNQVVFLAGSDNTLYLFK